MSSSKISGKALMYGLVKIADMIIGKSENPVVAGGIFVHGEDEVQSRNNAEKVRKYIQQYGSLGKAKERFEKENPGVYITKVISTAAAPKKPFLFGGKKYQSELKSYQDRVQKPRIFIRSGPAGGYQQSSLYKEVARGYYDSELNQDHIPKSQRIIYI